MSSALDPGNREPLATDTVSWAAASNLFDGLIERSQHSNDTAIREVRVIDPQTVDFLLGQPDPVLLTKLASYGDLQVLPEDSEPITRVALPALPANIATTDASTDPWPDEMWWRRFADPQLNRLMAAALKDNPGLAIATVRLAQAQAAAGVAASNRLPQVNADANASRGRQSENYIMPKPPLGVGGEVINQGAANINLGFDLDLWGRQKALILAARSQVDVARYAEAAARLTLTSALARSYAQLAAQYAQLDIVEATRRQRQAIADLTHKRLAAGLDTRLEVRQAETGTASLGAEAVQLETAIAVSRLQLAALSGAMPDQAETIERPRLAAIPLTVPAILPLDLLGRRPEIAAQGARIAAAREEVKAARAEYYPNINLTALIGFQSIGLGHLLSAASLTNSLGPALHLPLFDGGRIRANVDLRQGMLTEAIAQYNQSVLDAAQDVAEQLTRAAALDREAAPTAAALAAAEDGYRIALLRYGEGLSSYLSVLAVEGQLLNQRRAQADIEARRRDLYLQMLRALGGGFSSPAQANP